MLFEQRFWDPVARGAVTLTFRRWKRAQVVPGRRYRTRGGMIEVEADVRKLKGLGLTLSLDVGYRLSPRGAAYLQARR